LTINLIECPSLVSQLTPLFSVLSLSLSLCLSCRHAQLCEVISHAAKVAPKCCRLRLPFLLLKVSKCESRMVSQLLSPVDSGQSTSWDSKQLATCLQVSAAVAAAVAVTVVDATRRALLGVYLIFHMPPQLLPPRRLLTDQLQHHFAPHCTTLHHNSTTLSGYVNCLHK